jgi:hypothetical protein
LKLKKNDPKGKSTFQELTIIELEERLELASRCLCRIRP